ncbi:pyridoxamine 5'-phosphate oxidase family protein [Nonomuraea endophytica]|uniref:pyridoxamine 5'-phosphate oxidase family protein n=1 Tax=Nonomuraea endophytica TaxID=714136 RepID=UPI0037C9BE95
MTMRPAEADIGQTNAGSPPSAGGDQPPTPIGALARSNMTSLDQQECAHLIAPGGIGRVAFSAPPGPIVLPVTYQMHDGAVLFRTQIGGPMDQQLRTGTKGVELIVGFEVDQIDEAKREGWSVLVQGPAHHVTPDELPTVSGAGVQPWADGERELYVRIIPHEITGRRIHGSER